MPIYVKPGYAQLKANGNSLLFFSDYDPSLVSALKSQIPYTARRWNPEDKAWIIDPMYVAVIQKLAKDFLSADIQIPLVQNKHAPASRLIKLEYLGMTKDRQGADERTAFGFVDDGWNAIFPESVLQEWFDAAPTGPDQKPTLYGVLGVKREADQGAIKRAYRRAARQWHPDASQEPDSAEQFRAIQHAYEILRNDLQRRKYDAGLLLEASLRKNGSKGPGLSTGYRAPLRCGYILAVGQESLGRFVVAEIKQWEDVVNGQGQVMVSTWPPGADKFTVQWI